MCHLLITSIAGCLQGLFSPGKFLPANLVGSGMDIAAFRAKACILKDISFLLIAGSTVFHHKAPAVCCQVAPMVVGRAGRTRV